MIKINEKSLIIWQLELFKDIEDVRVFVGYRARDVVEEVLKYRTDIVFVYNHNYFDTKTGASFYVGAKDANEYVIEWDGDLLVHPDDVKRALANSGEFIWYAEVSSKEAVYIRTEKKARRYPFQRKMVIVNGPVLFVLKETN